MRGNQNETAIMSHIRQTCILLISAVLLVGAQAEEAVELPDNLKNPCKHDESSDYSSCLTKAINDVWPTLVEGIANLGLPKLDPLKIESLEEDYQIGAMKGHSIVRNVNVEGLAKTTFQAVRPNRTADRMSLEIDYAIPKIFVEGDYEADIVFGPIKNGGKGYFNLTAEGTSTTWSLDGRIENDRWVLEHVRSPPDVIKVEKMKIYFDDLFNGNKELNKAALAFANEYWRVLMYNTPLVVYDIVDARWTEFLNQMIFSKLSFAKTFP